MNKMKYYIVGAVMSAVLILFDQFTKYLAAIHLKAQAPFVLFENVLELNYLENAGAAFGIMQGKKSFLVVFTLLVILLILYFYIRIPAEKKFLFLRVTVVFLISGAIGNLIDRIRLHYVVDFIYFKMIHFPVFNVADIYVSCAAVFLALLIIFYYKEEDIAKLFPERGKG